MAMSHLSLHLKQAALGLAVLLSLAGAQAGAQHKPLEAGLIAVKMNENRFIDNADGTLTDRAAQITWKRCSLGQQWDEALTSCKGRALALSLDQAREAVQQINQSESFHQDWRLPSLTELARIASSSLNPEGVRISRENFPGTPASFFWTSSAKASGGYEPLWYAMSFGHEGLKAVPSDSKLFVRLVRYGN
jgi:hypothetical protein